jgi:hypothetical protein
MSETQGQHEKLYSLLPEVLSKIGSVLREEEDPTFVAFSYTCKAFLLIMMRVRGKVHRQRHGREVSVQLQILALLHPPSPLLSSPLLSSPLLSSPLLSSPLLSSPLLSSPPSFPLVMQDRMNERMEERLEECEREDERERMKEREDEEGKGESLELD